LDFVVEALPEILAAQNYLPIAGTQRMVMRLVPRQVEKIV
jgi:hypothetical protein